MELGMNVGEKKVFKPKSVPLSRADWIAMRRQHQANQKKQLEGLESQEIFKASIEAKLLEAGAAAVCASSGAKWFANFLRCGRESFIMMCEECQRTKDCVYKCSQKWCPRCNWRITMKRKSLLETMTAGMYGVKHVVLTQRNFDTLTHTKIQESRKNLLALRRQKIFGKVSGGCASLEFTNEGNGWHMHWHLLLQSQFIPAGELAIAWGKLVGQEYAIVKVMEVSDRSYVQELCKYVVTGSELAKWSPKQILEFVLALQRTRCFTVFGKFRGLQKFARSMEEIDRPDGPTCECGCQTSIVAPDEEAAYRIWEKLFS